MTTLEILIVIAIPIAAWLCFKAGYQDGVFDTLILLEEQGVLTLIEDDGDDEENS